MGGMVNIKGRVVRDEVGEVTGTSYGLVDCVIYSDREPLQMSDLI